MNHRGGWLGFLSALAREVVSDARNWRRNAGGRFRRRLSREGNAGQTGFLSALAREVVSDKGFGGSSSNPTPFLSALAREVVSDSHHLHAGRDEHGFLSALAREVVSDTYYAAPRDSLVFLSALAREVVSDTNSQLLGDTISFRFYPLWRGRSFPTVLHPAVHPPRWSFYPLWRGRSFPTAEYRRPNSPEEFLSALAREVVSDAVAPRSQVRSDSCVSIRFGAGGRFRLEEIEVGTDPTVAVSIRFGAGGRFRLLHPPEFRSWWAFGRV